MVIKEVKMIWAKREVKEFDIKEKGKKRHIKTDEKLWLNFDGISKSDYKDLCAIYDKLDKKYPSYEKEDGSIILSFSSKYDIPCILAIPNTEKVKGNFEEFVAQGRVMTKNCVCDLAINEDNGYIRAIQITEDGEPYGNPFIDFDEDFE